MLDVRITLLKRRRAVAFIIIVWCFCASCLMKVFTVNAHETIEEFAMYTQAMQSRAQGQMDERLMYEEQPALTYGDDFVSAFNETAGKRMSYQNGKKGLKVLKKKLQKQIRKYSGTHSIYVKNLNTNRWMVIHNRKMTPASVIKLYNMATVYDQIEKKRLKENRYVKGRLKSMITVSSNDAFNELLIKMGKGNPAKGVRLINKFCKKHGYKQTRVGGTIGPSSVRSVVHLQKGYTSVKDCGHILEDIYRGKLVSKKASKKMLNYLKAQERKWKIPAGLPKGVKSANKTGEYAQYEHDAAIVFSENADYIIVVLTEGDGAAIEHIRSISKTVYRYFNRS